MKHATRPPSLRQKIAQMLLIGFNGSEASAESTITHEIKENHIGGVILFDYDCQKQCAEKNIFNPEQVSQLTASLNRIASSSTIPPLFIGIDYEGGKVNRLKQNNGFVSTYSAIEHAAMSSADADKAFQAMAQQLKTLGINLNFAPCVDLAINPNNPVIASKERSFSTQPETVTQLAAKMSNAMNLNNIFYAIKHFPGHGSSDFDTHHGFVDITHSWHKNELIPFQQLIQRQSPPPMVMTAHLIHQTLEPQGLPATLSKQMLTGILRNQLHFKGLIVSDDMQMKAISDNFKLDDAVITAIDAGVDILLFGNQLVDQPQSATQLIDIIEEAVQSGHLTSKRINDSYNKIVSLKAKLPT